MAGPWRNSGIRTILIKGTSMSCGMGSLGWDHLSDTNRQPSWPARCCSPSLLHLYMSIKGIHKLSLLIRQIMVCTSHSPSHQGYPWWSPASAFGTSWMRHYVSCWKAAEAGFKTIHVWRQLDEWMVWVLYGHTAEHIHEDRTVTCDHYLITRAYIYTYVHTYVHTYIHTYIHTYKQVMLIWECARAFVHLKCLIGSVNIIKTSAAWEKQLIIGKNSMFPIQLWEHVATQEVVAWVL